MKNKQYIVGKLTEKECAKLCKKVVEANEDQDKKEHWDIEGEIDEERLKIDVKSMKRQNMYDPLPDERFHWVEFQNVRGDIGWLYGKADAFAFEIEDYFILVRKSALQKFMETKTNGKVLEKSKFPWPKDLTTSSVELSGTQLDWLIDGVDIWKIKPHPELKYSRII